MNEFETYIIYFIPHRAAPTWTSKQATSEKAVLECFYSVEPNAEAILAVYLESDDPGAGNRLKFAQDLKDGTEEMSDIMYDHHHRN